MYPNKQVEFTGELRPKTNEKIMYELHYWNNYRDCEYCHESNDLGELHAEMDELRKQDADNARTLRDYYAQMWIEDADGCTIEPLEQIGAIE